MKMTKEQDKALCMAVVEVLPAYESEYIFHNHGGHFAQRVLKHIGSKDYRYLNSSIYIALIGSCCKEEKRLSIPCIVRKEIERKIVDTFNRLNENEKAKEKHIL